MIEKRRECDDPVGIGRHLDFLLGRELCGQFPDYRVILRALRLLQGDERGQIDDIQGGRFLGADEERVDGGMRHTGRAADEVAPYPPLTRIEELEMARPTTRKPPYVERSGRPIPCAACIEFSEDDGTGFARLPN